MIVLLLCYNEQTLQSLCAAPSVEEPMLQDEDREEEAAAAECSLPPCETHREPAKHQATQYSFRRPHRSLGMFSICFAGFRMVLGLMHLRGPTGHIELSTDVRNIT